MEGTEPRFPEASRKSTVPASGLSPGWVRQGVALSPPQIRGPRLRWRGRHLSAPHSQSPPRGCGAPRARVAGSGRRAPPGPRGLRETPRLGGPGLQAGPRRGAQAKQAAGDPGVAPGPDVEDAEVGWRRGHAGSARSLGSGPERPPGAGTRAAALGAGSAPTSRPTLQSRGSAAHLVCPGATARVGGRADEPARFQRTGRSLLLLIPPSQGYTRATKRRSPGKPN